MNTIVCSCCTRFAHQKLLPVSSMNGLGWHADLPGRMGNIRLILRIHIIHQHVWTIIHLNGLLLNLHGLVPWYYLTHRMIVLQHLIHLLCQFKLFLLHLKPLLLQSYQEIHSAVVLTIPHQPLMMLRVQVPIDLATLRSLKLLTAKRAVPTTIPRFNCWFMREALICLLCFAAFHRRHFLYHVFVIIKMINHIAVPVLNHQQPAEIDWLSDTSHTQSYNNLRFPRWESHIQSIHTERIDLLS